MNFYKETPPHLLAEYDMEFFFQDSHRVAITAGAHIHTAVEILYITDGRFKIDVEGEQSFAFPGDMIIFPSNTVHSVYHLENAFGSYCVLKLSSQLLFQIFKVGNNVKYIFPFIKRQKENKLLYRPNELPQNIKAIWKMMIEGYIEGNEVSMLAERSYACLLAVLIYKEMFFSCENSSRDIQINSKMRSLIYESVGYINENYSSDITPTECAQMINLSYSYYARLFHEIIGKSFKEYLSGIRLAKAYNALLVTDLPVTEIALTCGYKNPAYFASEFKKCYGVTPREVQRSAIITE